MMLQANAKAKGSARHYGRQAKCAELSWTSFLNNDAAKHAHTHARTHTILTHTTGAHTHTLCLIFKGRGGAWRKRDMEGRPHMSLCSCCTCFCAHVTPSEWVDTHDSWYCRPNNTHIHTHKHTWTQQMQQTRICIPHKRLHKRTHTHAHTHTHTHTCTHVHSNTTATAEQHTYLVSMYCEIEGRLRMISFTRCVDSFWVR